MIMALKIGIYGSKNGIHVSEYGSKNGIYGNKYCPYGRKKYIYGVLVIAFLWYAVRC